MFKDVDPNDGRPRPMIPKGSFLEVNDPARLRAWENSPSMCKPKLMVKMQLRQGQVLGPALETEHTYMFASVRIMHPVTNAKAWVNVWTSENNHKVRKGIFFCWLLSASAGLKAIKTFKKRHLADATSAEAIAQKALQKEQGVTYAIDLESSDDEFETPAHIALTDELVSEEKETQDMQKKFWAKREILDAPPTLSVFSLMYLRPGQHRRLPRRRLRPCQVY